MSQSTKIFVGGLIAPTKPEELRKLFENYGVVVECDIMNRCGFVHMETPAMAINAIDALNATEFKGQVIVVEPGRPKERKNGSGSGESSNRQSRGHNRGRQSGGARGGGMLQAGFSADKLPNSVKRAAALQLAGAIMQLVNSNTISATGEDNASGGGGNARSGSNVRGGGISATSTAHGNSQRDRSANNRQQNFGNNSNNNNRGANIGGFSSDSNNRRRSGNAQNNHNIGPIRNESGRQQRNTPYPSRGGGGTSNTGSNSARSANMYKYNANGQQRGSQFMNQPQQNKQQQQQNCGQFNNQPQQLQQQRQSQRNNNSGNNFSNYQNNNNNSNNNKSNSNNSTLRGNFNINPQNKSNSWSNQTSSGQLALNSNSYHDNNNRSGFLGTGSSSMDNGPNFGGVFNKMNSGGGNGGGQDHRGFALPPSGHQQQQTFNSTAFGQQQQSFNNNSFGNNGGNSGSTFGNNSGNFGNITGNRNDNNTAFSRQNNGSNMPSNQFGGRGGRVGDRNQLNLGSMSAFRPSTGGQSVGLSPNTNNYQNDFPPLGSNRGAMGRGGGNGRGGMQRTAPRQNINMTATNRRY